MLLYWLFVIFFIIEVENHVVQAMYEECEVETFNEKVKGTCTSMEHCPSVWGLFNTYPMKKFTKDEKQYLTQSRSQCDGKFNGKPLVCCTCGQLHTNDSRVRVVDGTMPAKGEWPWIVALSDVNSDESSFMVRCGGSLISERWVLTAAHCIRPGRISKIVRIGEMNFTTSNETETQDVPIASIIPHPDYDFASHTYENDIALIYLNSSVKFKFNVQPVCLPNSFYKNENNFSRKQFAIAGWGSTAFGETFSDNLLHASVAYVPNHECATAYKSKNTTINSKMVCAGKSSQDSCQGDSGGPLVIRNPSKRTYLIGVISFGVNCGERGIPGVYTRVTAFLDWINEVMELKLKFPNLRFPNEIVWNHSM